ncbi:hypothetical protein OUZ56_002635 [Daphnia magna]|uniref:Uncharacterized protein n=1 Tax=Daphnia magna TaxID=35525 RepID=A0ABR0A6T7_9CRUS|nr:hypothetical protein OUZ56_002635 [Daphnia magna]
MLSFPVGIHFEPAIKHRAHASRFQVQHHIHRSRWPSCKCGTVSGASSDKTQAGSRMNVVKTSNGLKQRRMR